MLLGCPARIGSVLSLFLGLGAFSPAASALGLGALEVESNLGQSLRATAPVHLGSGESVTNLEASLASQADYQMVGKPRQPIVDAVDIKLRDGRTPTLVLTSSRPIQDPLFEVLVRVGDGSNQVLKLFTVALDPAQATPPQSQKRPAPSGQTAPSESRLQTRELPSEARQKAETGPAVDRPEVHATEGWAKRDKYGPVRQGDTLSTIVRRLRLDTSVPLESAVVATWKANPEAFIDGNMNLLRQGAVLEVPDESRVRQYSATEAKDIITGQRRKWNDRGRPQIKTNPGHERYRLKVSLQPPEEEQRTGGGDPANHEQGSSQEAAQSPNGGGPSPDSGNQGSSAGGGGDNSDPGAGESGNNPGASSTNPSGAEGDGSALQGGNPGQGEQVSQLQAKVEELKQQLSDNRAEANASVASLQDRVKTLNQELEKQQSVVDQQSAALERVSNQQGPANGPNREQYILWLLAGINLLMLLAIVALWWKLRRVQTQAAVASEPEEPSQEEAEDPLAVANAQAAAGELKQARSTLWGGIAAEPRNWDLYARLLDLYEGEDADQFEDVARRLMDQLGEEEPEWQEEIRQRGRQLKPESPLFAGMAGGAGATAAMAAPTFDFDGLDVETAQGEPEPDETAPSGDADDFSLEFQGEEAPAPSPGGSDFSLDFNEESAQPVEGEEGGPGTVEQASELEFDLGLGEAEDSAEAGAVPAEEGDAPGEAEEGTASPEAGGEDLSFDLDSLGLDLDGNQPGESDLTFSLEDDSGVEDEGQEADEKQASSPDGTESPEEGTGENALSLSMEPEGEGPGGEELSFSMESEPGSAEEEELDLSLVPETGSPGEEELSLSMEPESGSAGGEELDLSLESEPGDLGEEEMGLSMDSESENAGKDGDDLAPALETRDESEGELSFSQESGLAGGGEDELNLPPEPESVSNEETELNLSLETETGESGGDELLPSLDPAPESVDGEGPDQALPPEEEAGPASEGRSAGNQGAEEGLSFEVAPSGGEDDLQEGAAQEDPGSPLGEADEETAQPADGPSEDELGIKLDLAQAWMDMGDQESARGLLEEVEARGSSDQQARARQIMSGLS
jgi:pilus assembly protein FimV